ncbi:MAG: hypothetical protein KGL31_01135 [candidate division NC10 bacterium]|nr:hypothetical protein [candidate division NC10 bacterium]MDE2320514.1 hypothetical protein [candidate division NC10 bacterium]
MFALQVRSYLVGCALVLLPLLLQGCLGSVQYLASPGVRAGLHADILNFSDREIDPNTVDQVYLDVARLMGITPDPSKPRPQVLVVSPAQIHQEYLRLGRSAKAQAGIALALYVPHANRILIPHFDRTLLIHELAHYFTFHYLSAPRSQWEAIADKVVDAEESGG